MTTPDDEEVAQEAKEAGTPTPEQTGETVVIDGKTYVKSRNPYYLTYPAEPEYVYAEKGKEFTGLGETMAKLRDKITGKSPKKPLPGCRRNRSRKWCARKWRGLCGSRAGAGNCIYLR